MKGLLKSPIGTRVIDEMIILKVISGFDGHLIDT
jgi:hypothetical protein